MNYGSTFFKQSILYTMALIIDTETTGLPDRRGHSFGSNPSYEELDKYNTARMVQFTMMLVNDKFEKIMMKDFIVKADGFVIENASFHGITNEISQHQGITIQDVAKELVEILPHVSHVIAHNSDFDMAVIKSEMHRAGLQYVIDALDKKTVLCTMAHTKKIIQIRGPYGFKNPSLAELYRHVMGKPLENAHNSAYDVTNLHDILKTMYDANTLNYKKKIVYKPLQQ